MEDKGYSRAEIADIVGEFKLDNTRDTYPITNANMINALDPDIIQQRIADGEYSDEEIEFSPNLQRFAALAGQSKDTETDKESDMSTVSIPKLEGDAKVELSTAFSDTGLNALLDKLGKGNEQLFDPMGTPVITTKKGANNKALKGSDARWLDRDGNEYTSSAAAKKATAGSGAYIGNKSQVTDYLYNL